MEDTLDHFGVGNKNFRIAKTIFYVMLACFIFLLLFSFILRFLPRYAPVYFNSTLIGFAGAIPMLIIVLLAPVGLICIIRSYVKKEELTKRRLLYLIGILLFNGLFLFFIYSVARNILGVF